MLNKLKLHKIPETANIARKVLEELNKDAGVEGVFLSGSTVFGGNDEYSDIDINLFGEDKNKLKEIFLEIVFSLEFETLFHFEPHFLEDTLVLYLKDLQKIDIGFLDRNSDFKRFQKSKTLILKDSSNFVEKSIIENKGHIDQIFAKKFLYLAIADVIAVRREVRRKDYLEARFNLEEARQCLATYINLSNDYFYIGYDKFMTYINDETRLQFKESTNKTTELKDISDSALILLNIIERLGLVDREIVESIRCKFN